jgi:hypothetical protein
VMAVVIRPKMPDPDFNLAANLYLPSEESDNLDVQQVIQLLSRKLPDAVVDFRRGREHVVANIERLKSLGAPEIIYRGEYQLLDRTICIEIPLDGYSSTLTGFTTGLSFYDGCVGLVCEPFNIDALKAGSALVADALALDLSLGSQGSGGIELLVKRGHLSPQQLVAERFADLVNVAKTRIVEDDWQRLLGAACARWLSDHPEEQTTAPWRSVFRDATSLVRSLTNRMISIGTVRRATVVDFDREFWHSCLVVDYDEWSGLVTLSGHPEPLLANR